MQFKVQFTEYSKEGSLTNLVHAEYFGTADSAELRYNDLNVQYWYDDDGKKTAVKRYQVKLFVLTYKEIEDPSEFFARFK